MSDNPSAPTECERIEGELGELALGILTGRERAAVLAHLDDCPRCSAEEERLSLVADALLQVGPEIDPPVGFEVRLFDRLDAQPRARGRRRGRTGRVPAVWALAAALTAIALGFGIGWGAAPGSVPGGGTAGLGSKAGGEVAVAGLRSGGRTVGSVSTYAGTPGWLFMTVRGAGLTGMVTCRITVAGGDQATVGSFRLSRGAGVWGVALPVGAGRVRSAALIGTDGQVLATARLAT